MVLMFGWNEIVSYVILCAESESGLGICPSHQVSKTNKVEGVKNDFINFMYLF